MINKQLVNFIKDSRKKGYGDIDLRNALLNNGWPAAEVEKAFKYIEPKFVNKNQVTLFLSDELMEVLSKRAKKNMLTVGEQIEDILRRSTVSLSKRKSVYDEKLDDKLVGLFSRRRGGRERKE